MIGDSTGRGIPFWNTHQASKLLAEDESCGIAKTMKPKTLWRSRAEYQEFSLHMYFASMSTRSVLNNEQLRTGNTNATKVQWKSTVRPAN